MKLMKTVLLASAALLAATAAQATELNIWGLQAFNKQADALIKEMAEKFGEENGVDVNYVIVPANVLTQRLASAFEGKSSPDVFMQLGQNSQYYAANGMTMPIDDVLASMREKEGGIYESMVPQAIYQNEAHSVPIEIDLVPMFARKDLLKEAGVEVPATWQDLRKASQAIIKAHPQYMGLGITLSSSNDAESALRMLIWSFGGAMFGQDSSTITWNSPETVSAYQYVKDMFDEGTIPRSALTWDDGGNNTAYQTGRAAFIMNPPSVYSWMVENDKELLEDTDLINIPAGQADGESGATLLGSFSWMVSSQTEEADLAKKWINYFFNPEAYQKLIEVTGGRWYPIFPQMAKSMPLFTENPSFANFDALATNGKTIGYSGAPTPLASKVYASKTISTSIQKMLVDGMSPQEAVVWAADEIAKLAQEK
nr:sugar ABC transporter substrate-binding protein [uncultured Cohaesibacter sp.]